MTPSRSLYLYWCRLWNYVILKIVPKKCIPKGRKTWFWNFASSLKLSKLLQLLKTYFSANLK